MRFFYFLFLFLPQFLSACDGCSASAGQTIIGVSPQFYRHFAGIRYRFSSYKSFLNTNKGMEFHSKEQFHAAELWARFYPHKKIQLMLFVPFQFHQQWSEKYQQIQGLGDVSVLANTKILKTGIDTLSSSIKQNIWLGAGIKLPTGKYKTSDDTKSSAINFQTGSGSFDFLFQVNYSLKYKNLGFNTDISAKINTPNPNKFLYGNRFSGHHYLSYSKKVKKYGMFFYSGFYQEFARKDWKRDLLRNETGGYLGCVSAGVEVFSPKIGLGFSCYQPVIQNLALGTLHANARIVSHFSFFF